MQASATTLQDTGPTAAYSRFRQAVAQAQLSGWLAELPPARGVLVDISGPESRAAPLAAAAGHSVLRVIPADRPVPTAGPVPADCAVPEAGPVPAAGPVPTAGPVPADCAVPEAGRLRTVSGDGGLEFLTDACADGVIAEDRTLSRSLAAEAVVGEIARVLRPGGGVLACVDSLTLGMAVLAEQHHWPQLVDVPHADVVLVPWPDETITRCYGAEQLRELFTAGGFDVRWIRARTVFSPQTVTYLLARDPGSFGALLRAELGSHGDDSVGGQLILSAVLP